MQYTLCKTNFIILAIFFIVFSCNRKEEKKTILDVTILQNKKDSFVNNHPEIIDTHIYQNTKIIKYESLEKLQLDIQPCISNYASIITKNLVEKYVIDKFEISHFLMMYNDSLDYCFNDTYHNFFKLKYINNDVKVLYVPCIEEEDVYVNKTDDFFSIHYYSSPVGFSIILFALIDENSIAVFSSGEIQEGEELQMDSIDFSNTQYILKVEGNYEKRKLIRIEL